MWGIEIGWHDEIGTILLAVALVLNIVSFVFAQQLGNRLVMISSLVTIVGVSVLLVLTTPGGALILNFLRFFVSAQTAP